MLASLVTTLVYGRGGRALLSTALLSPVQVVALNVDSAGGVDAERVDSADSADSADSVDGAVVDASLVRDGLRARLGEEADAWTIELDGRTGASVQVGLTREDGAAITRTLELCSDTVEGRSRELATAMALLIDGVDDDPSAMGDGGETGSSRSPTRAAVRGWLTLGPRIGVGSPARSDYDVGGDLLGGIELVRGHLHPLVLLGWSGAGRASLGVNYLHLGTGLAAGAGLWKERLWVGGAVIPRAIWLKATEGSRSASSWSGGGDIVALGHYRRSLGERLELQVSLRLGLEVMLVPLVISGSTATLLRGDVRAHLSGAVGLRW